MQMPQLLLGSKAKQLSAPKNNRYGKVTVINQEQMIPLLSDYIVDKTEDAMPTTALDTTDEVHQEDDESKNKRSHSNNNGTALQLFECRPRHFMNKLVVAIFYIFTKL